MLFPNFPRLNPTGVGRIQHLTVPIGMAVMEAPQLLLGHEVLQTHRCSPQPQKSYWQGGNGAALGSPVCLLAVPIFPQGEPGLGCKTEGIKGGRSQSGQENAWGCSCALMPGADGGITAGSGSVSLCPTYGTSYHSPLTPQWKGRPTSPNLPGFTPKMRSGEQSTAPLSSADSQLVSGQIAGLGPELGIIEQK